MVKFNSLPKTEEKFPTSYREEEAKYFLERAHSNDSSLLISIPGLGKSVFLRFLAYHPQVKRHYLEEEADKILFILIDLNDLAELTSKAFYYLFLRRIMDTLEREKLKKEIQNAIKDVYNRTQSISILTELLDELKGVVSFLCFEHDLKIVLMIDKFDWACQIFETAFFNNLRSLRDVAKNKFVYLFASVKDPIKVASREKIGRVYDLAFPFQYYLKPMNQNDTLRTIQRLEKERRLQLSDKQRTEIATLSGGHPGLFKACLQTISHEKDKSWSELKENLVSYLNIQIQLRKIWEYFDKGEQEQLKTLVSGTTKENLNAKIISKIIQKHALIEEDSKLKTFTPLLETYITEVESESLVVTVKDGIWLNDQSNTVYRDGTELERPLTKMEQKLLTFFYENENRICERDEIAGAIWGTEAVEGVSDEAIDQIISRLRGKIEDDKSNPKYLVTIRGRGFKFTNKVP